MYQIRIVQASVSNKDLLVRFVATIRTNHKSARFRVKSECRDVVNVIMMIEETTQRCECYRVSHTGYLCSSVGVRVFVTIKFVFES